MPDIETAACSACGGSHTVVYLHSRCHPQAPTWVRVNLEHAQADVICCDCGEKLTTLELHSFMGEPLR